jgi:hypothetical protein
MLNTVRFKIARTVAEHLHLTSLKRRARQASVTDVRLLVESRNCSRDEFRVTCSTALAIYFVEELKRVANQAQARRNFTLSAECSRTISATIKAIDEGDRGPAIVYHPPTLGTSPESRV